MGMQRIDPNVRWPRSNLAPQFKPGHPGGPGRPKGSRNKLTEAFIADVFEKWERSGGASLDVIEPVDLVRVVASLVPKQTEQTDTTPFGELTDDESAAVGELLAALRATEVDARPVGEAAEQMDSGGQAEEGTEPPRIVPSLSEAG